MIAARAALPASLRRAVKAAANDNPRANPRPHPRAGGDADTRRLLSDGSNGVLWARAALLLYMLAVVWLAPYLV